jgi:hypothetical protein
LAPLADLLCDSFGKFVDFAKESNIKVAVNPSKQQLSLPESELKRIFSKRSSNDSGAFGIDESAEKEVIIEVKAVRKYKG